jgi:hypothetical protein
VNLFLVAPAAQDDTVAMATVDELMLSIYSHPPPEAPCGPRPIPPQARLRDRRASGLGSGCVLPEPVRAPNAVVREQVGLVPLGLVWTAPTEHPGATGFGREPHGA